MGSGSHFIRQFYPALGQVARVRGCSLRFIRADIPHRSVKRLLGQEVARVPSAVLSRVGGVVAAG